MRTTIIEGKDAPAVVKDEDRTMATLHDQPILLFQGFKAAHEHKFAIRCIHAHTPMFVTLRTSKIPRAIRIISIFFSLAKQPGFFAACEPRRTPHLEPQATRYRARCAVAEVSHGMDFLPVSNATDPRDTPLNSQSVDRADVSAEV
ncbi:hypothetical protein CR51_41885 [Caballeronia megalochromosomata]|nr:hypothetical protein CR51_41885 [Caballeronia megalochromosomata]